MKTHIDFFETLKGEMLGMKKFRSRLIRFWGTETIDGIEVMNARFTVYPGFATDKNIQRMCKLLGMWDQIQTANFKPIAGFFLYFNGNKNIAAQEELNAELLAEKIDEFMPMGIWKTSTINYIDKNDPSKFKGWTKEQILEYIDNDYRKVFDSSTNGTVVGDTLDQTVLGKYVLFDDDTEFEVKVKSVQIVPVLASSIERRVNANITYYTSLALVIEYQRKTVDIDPEGLVMKEILAEQDEAKLAALIALQQSSVNVFNSEYEDTIYYQIPPRTDLIWYKGRLRVDAIRAVGIPTKQAVNILLGALDTGQIKKKVSWWKKALGLVLIVIAIVIAFYTNNWQLVPATIAAIAVNVGIAVMLMVVIQSQWVKTNAASAEYMGRWVKIGSIISIVAGITAVIQNIATNIANEAAKEAAKESMIQAGASSVAAEAAVQAMTTEAITAYNATMGVTVTSTLTVESAMTAIKSYITTNWKSMSMKVAGKALEMRQQDMDGKLQDKRAYAESLAEEANKDADSKLAIGIEDLKIYTENLARIQTPYDFDFPYQAEYATIHIGNIQRSSFAKGSGLNLIAEDLV